MSMHLSQNIHGIVSVTMNRGRTTHSATLDINLTAHDGSTLQMTAFGPQPPVIDGDAIDAIQTAAYAEGRKDEREEWGKPSGAYLSWSGHNVRGDEASIKAVREALHLAGTVPELRDRIVDAERARQAPPEWEALRAQMLEALRKAESWLAEWASADPYISEIRAAIAAATRRANG